MNGRKADAGMIELWGTFSVRDHLVERAFIADVLLYDRLVIPTLPEDGDPEEWPKAWDLDRQKRLLGELGDLAIPVPWTDHRRNQWQDRFDAKQAAERAAARAEIAERVASDVSAARAAENEDQSYAITRELLADYANRQVDDTLFKRLRATGKARPGSSLEAVTAYPSYKAFSRDVPATTAAQLAGASLLTPTRIFGWSFFVPAAFDKGEAEHLRLLKLAADLARRTDFIELRGEFYKWLADVSQGDMSPEEARAEMEARLLEYEALMRGQRWKTWTRHVMKVGGALSGLLGLTKYPLAGAVGPAVIAIVDHYADPFLSPQAVPQRLKGAAMFHDARGHFGWQPSAEA